MPDDASGHVTSDRQQFVVRHHRVDQPDLERPRRSSSSARFRPASRGSRCVPPKVGGIPRLFSGLANSARSLATAR